MTDQHTDFPPERVDEQIERLAQAPEMLSLSDTASQRLLRHLQDSYAPARTEQDIRSLGQAWERIISTTAYQAQWSLRSSASPETPAQLSQRMKQEDVGRREPHASLRFRTLQSPLNNPLAPSLPVKSRFPARHLFPLAAGFLLVVVLGSLILGLIAVHRSQVGTDGPTIPPVSIYAGEGFSLLKLDARTGKQLWSQTIPISVDEMPVVANGLVYLKSHTEVYALDTRNASVRWHITLPEQDSQPTIPVVVGKTLYLGGSYAGTVYALDALTGKQRWLYHFPDQHDGQFTISDLSVADGIVYGSEVHAVHNVGSSSFFALDASTGHSLWRIPAERGEAFGTSWFSAPIVWDGAAYVVSSISQDGITGAASSTSAIYAFDAKTGKVLWGLWPIEGLTDSPLVISDGIVYLTTTHLISIAANGQVLQEEGTLTALQASDGNSLWQYQVPAHLVLSQHLFDGLLYLGTNPPSGSGAVSSLTAHTRVESWHWTAPSYVTDPLIGFGGVLLVGAPDSLYALDAATGTQLWRARDIIPNGSSVALVTIAS